MNLDEAMAYASKDKCFWTGEVHTALETLAAEVERLRDELAEAKAANVCPVQVVYCEPDYERTATVVLWSNADAQRFADWLNDRIRKGASDERG